MKRVVTDLAVVILCMLAAAGVTAQDTARRTPWGDPDLEGIWTNATLTPLQRPPELAAKEFFTAEEAAQFRRTRLEQTNADRPLPPGQVGAYNDAFFERGTSLVRSGRTSLIVQPPDGRIPELTPEAVQQLSGLRPALRPTSPRARRPRLRVRTTNGAAPARWGGRRRRWSGSRWPSTLAKRERRSAAG